jgi:glutamate-5-semialdehyde dehydrogenase
VASLISRNQQHQEHFFQKIKAPFVGNGFTRWVDGQFVYAAPELGLSNWDCGRILGRGAILSADKLVSIRLRMRQSDGGMRR